MNRSWRPVHLVTGIAIGVLGLTIAFAAEPPKEELVTTGIAATDSVKTNTTNVELERAKAQLAYDIYVATLDVVHHHYFHQPRAAIPARAMEDIFSEIKFQSKIEARWISVNTNAMSLDHTPATDFEKRAARELADGKSEVEAIEEGYYRRAGTIALNDGCLSCHDSASGRQGNKKAKFAGLVISIPLVNKTGQLP